MSDKKYDGFINEICESLNKRILLNCFIFKTNEQAVYFLDKKIWQISDSINIRYFQIDIIKASKEHILNMIELFDISDIIDNYETDEILDEIGKNECMSYFNIQSTENLLEDEIIEMVEEISYPSPISLDRLKDFIKLYENCIVECKSIDDEFKVKHLNSVWDKYSSEDIERLLP